MKERTYEIKRELSETERQGLSPVSDLLAKLLFHRNIKDEKALRDFLEINYETQTHDPFLMKDLEKGVQKILEAINKNQKICIYSDYDADGIPGAVILSDFFKKIGFKNYFVYIPHRNIEGFGLNNKAIQEIKNREAELIVTIDCGIADIDQVDLANSLGLEVIITDHHEVGEETPKAFAIIDPKQKDCAYPDKNLCGSGVIFKVVCGAIKLGNFDLPDGWEKWLLDMVGIATLSDMVPLVGENRIFAHYGLIVLRKSRRKGLLKLLKDSRIDQTKLTEEDVVFSITPKINAASRMGDPETAFKMLSSDDDVEANESMNHLTKINNDRKTSVALIVKEINKYVRENLISEKGELTVPVLVKGNPNWSPSLLGLVASNLVDKYGCPVFLWGRGEGEELKGSCRSDGSVDVFKLMQKIDKPILETFGGHVMAGGFVLSFDHTDSLENMLIENYKGLSAESTNFFHDLIDHQLSLDEINWELFEEINKMAPFGIGNDRPVFLLENVPVHDVNFFGKEKSHLKILFKNSKNFYIPAIQFFAGDTKLFENIKSGDRISLVAHLEQSNFAGKRELRLRIVNVL